MSLPQGIDAFYGAIIFATVWFIIFYLIEIYLEKKRK